jgi:hypothetical protein
MIRIALANAAEVSHLMDARAYAVLLRAQAH